ncbi:MAG: NTP transferase domain-containing protein, partial [Actinobacteria bacterium]|nr:NTP transferase domain-containing protein [Actinomycetota bacterium]
MTDAPSWTVVIPVKVLSAAKSRMATVTPPTSELAFAFFQDTLEAALASTAVGEVVVATGDDRVRATAQARGCLVVSDVDHPGINAAARQAVAQRSGRGGVAIVVSDLPAVTADSLTSVLSAASAHPTSFIADADGTGTTMWMSCDGTDIDPRFGLASRAAHVDVGAVDLIAVSPEMDAPWASA